jgi:hypothetical protein
MLNECGKHKKVSDISMHSQRGRWERGKNGNLGITLTPRYDSCPPRPYPYPKLYPPFSPIPDYPWQHGSPLVLDLNGDGVTSTFIYETSTYFDLDNNGMRERTGWVQSDDGTKASNNFYRKAS